MKKFSEVLLNVVLCIFLTVNINAQERETDINKRIDELISTLVKERRNWNDAAAGLVKIGEPAITPLIKVLRDNSLDEWSRRKASWVIRDINSTKAVEPLIEILVDTQFDPQIRAHAANVLGRLGSEKAVDPLAQVVESEHTAVRNSAVLALARLKSEKAIGPLTRSLNDENFMVRLNAVGGLGSLDTDKVIDPLIRAVKDENDVVRASAIKNLAKFRSEKVVDIIIDALKDSMWSVRHTAKEILLKMGLADCDKVTALMRDKNGRTRWNVLHLIGKSGAKDNTGLFINALKDPDWMVRNEAAVALSRIKGSEHIGKLIKLLDNKNPDVREESAWILGELKAVEAAEPLKKLLNDKNENVSNTAKFALKKIENPGNVQLEKYGNWMKKPQSEWPQITMINNIEYTDKSHPVAGCGFLLNTGKEILAATAKHVLKYFKSEKMNSVSFKNTLKVWRMFPKNNPDDAVIIDKLINENIDEPILEVIPPNIDWLLFSVKEKSKNIQPLLFRKGKLIPGEKIYIIGWRYSDKDCPQVIYEGNFEKILEDGTVIISTKDLADNKMPGLSGSPVIDSKGYVIGIMSQKYGKMERLSPIEYPMKKLGLK